MAIVGSHVLTDNKSGQELAKVEVKPNGKVELTARSPEDAQKAINELMALRSGR